MELFFEKIKSNPALREQYEDVLKKHEASKDRNAAAAELSLLARAEGYDATPGGILSAFAPSGEIGEQELEAVSGGGSQFAFCAFAGKRFFITATHHDGVERRYDGNPPFQIECPHKGDIVCTWLGCRCHGTDHCKNGWHRCDEKGFLIPGHSAGV